MRSLQAQSELTHARQEADLNQLRDDRERLRRDAEEAAQAKSHAQQQTEAEIEKIKVMKQQIEVDHAAKISSLKAEQAEVLTGTSDSCGVENPGSASPGIARR